jgi:hypothetical protein
VHRSVRAMIGAAAGTLALAAGAAPALADGFTLKLSAPATPVVGKSMVLQATGTMPPEDIEFPYYFSLDAIPTAVTTTCPPDRWEGVQFAQANGGTVVVLSQLLRPDASGDFSVPVAVTPTSPGSLVLCGYVDDGSLGTQATASLPFVIEARPPRSPRRVTPAVQVVRDIRSCRALLTGKAGRSCAHRAIKRANARCRKLRSHRRETRCLRSVRRAAKRAA